MPNKTINQLTQDNYQNNFLYPAWNPTTGKTVKTFLPIPVVVDPVILNSNQFENITSEEWTMFEDFGYITAFLNGNFSSAKFQFQLYTDNYTGQPTYMINTNQDSWEVPAVPAGGLLNLSAQYTRINNGALATIYKIEGAGNYTQTLYSYWENYPGPWDIQIDLYGRNLTEGVNACIYAYGFLQ